MVKVEYRRADTAKTWHFNRNCSYWPHNSFNIMRIEKFPANFELCNQCVALERLKQSADPKSASD